MLYVTIRSEDGTDILGVTKTKKSAQRLMKNDFEKLFLKYHQETDESTFETHYQEDVGLICELKEDSEWLDTMSNFQEWKIVAIPEILD